MKNDKTEYEIIDVTSNFGTLYHPKSALVFYQTENPNRETYVEFFDMDQNGNPINAHPLTVREAQRLSKTLNIQNKKDKNFLKPKGIISPSILFTDSSENGKVIWFTQEQERDLFFVKNLNIPNGKANVPPLLWIANKQNLKIFALETDQRPAENAQLFHAPFFNVYENGNVCMGTDSERAGKNNDWPDTDNTSLSIILSHTQKWRSLTFEDKANFQKELKLSWGSTDINTNFPHLQQSDAQLYASNGYELQKKNFK